MMNRTLKWIAILFLMFFLSACDRGQIFHKLRPNSVILAFGDSLTFGTGADPGMAYPEQLQRMTARNVFNAGLEGELSADGVRRLPQVLEEVDPDLVILCHGGNDLLQHLDQQQLRANLRLMFEAVNQRGIPMVMVAVPQANMLVSDATMYKELADELNIPLIEGVLGEILADRELKSDQVHPNSAGYRKLSEAIADLLFKLSVI